MSSLYARMLNNPHPDLYHAFEDEEDDWAQEALRDLDADIKLAATEFRDKIKGIFEKHDCGRIADAPDWDNTGELIRDDLECNVFFDAIAALGRE